MKLRIISFAAIGAALISGACTDPIHITAQSPTTVDTVTVYSLSGSSPSLPSGLDVFTRQPVRVDGFGAFDLSFDILSANQIRILPVKFVVSSPNGVRNVGLRRQAGAFEAVLNASSGTYPVDSTMVVAPGEVVLVQTTRAQAGEFCQFALSPYLYAKLSVMSVDLVARTVQIQLGFDPNCGFRSFQPGIPTG